MSIAKIDLSMTSIDRNELYATISSDLLMDKFEVSDLNKLIEDNEEIYWTGDAEEYFTKELNFEVVCSGNTYNHESDLSDILQWSVMVPENGKSDPLYDNGILLVQFHHGGDARGNYGSVKAYKWNGKENFFFLETVVGWYVTDLNGERLDQYDRFASGYCSNPTHELNKHIVKILEVTEEKAKLELDDGNTVVVYPEHNADFG